MEYKLPKTKFKPTKEKGAYSIYSEDTITKFSLTEDIVATGLKKSEIRFILYELGYIIIHYVCTKNQGFTLPLSLGKIWVIGEKREATSYNLTKIYKKPIWQRNTHTGGLVFRIENNFRDRWKGSRCFTFLAGKLMKVSVSLQIRRSYMHFSTL